MTFKGSWQYGRPRISMRSLMRQFQIEPIISNWIGKLESLDISSTMDDLVWFWIFMKNQISRNLSASNNLTKFHISIIFFSTLQISSSISRSYWFISNILCMHICSKLYFRLLKWCDFVHIQKYNKRCTNILTCSKVVRPK